MNPPAGAPTPCLTTVNVRVFICLNKQDSISAKYCPKRYGGCFTNRGLRTTDKNYSIISFKMRSENLCGEQFEMEAINSGATWNEAQAIVNRACAGSIVKFSCIRAKDKNGNVQVLHPLTIQL